MIYLDLWILSHTLLMLMNASRAQIVLLVEAINVLNLVETYCVIHLAQLAALASKKHQEPCFPPP